jgi:hypothetical protein
VLELAVIGNKCGGNGCGGKAKNVVLERVVKLLDDDDDVGMYGVLLITEAVCDNPVGSGSNS